MVLRRTAVHEQDQSCTRNPIEIKRERVRVSTGLKYIRLAYAIVYLRPRDSGRQGRRPMAKHGGEKERRLQRRKKKNSRHSLKMSIESVCGEK
jgi:hypothetical protein